MSLYTLALFLHVSGAIGACVSLGIWLFGLAALRRARRLEQVRALAWLLIIASPLMVFSALLIAFTGLDMALSTWGLETGWIVVALVSFVLMAPVGPFLLAAPMYTILAQTREEPDGPLSADLDRRIHDPVMGTAANTLATVLLGIIFLMTTKPQLVTSLLVMVIAFLLGLFSGLPFWRAAHIRARRTAAHASSAGGDPFLKKTLWTRRW